MTMSRVSRWPAGAVEAFRTNRELPVIRNRRTIHVLSSIVVAGVALTFAASVAAARPSADGQLSLQLVPAGASAAAPSPGYITESGCTGAAVGHFLLVRQDGQVAGSAGVCATRLAEGPVMFQFALDQQIVIRLAGGTITANPGASYIVGSPPGAPAFAGPDYCWSRYDPSFALLNCAGSITSGTGVYAGATGWVTYQWFFVTNGQGGPSNYWLQQPTLTITFG